MTDMSTATPALQLQGVRKVYDSGDQQVVALDDVDLTVGADEMLLLVGPSGSGKTTLLTVAGALLRPSGGTVRTLFSALDTRGEFIGHVLFDWSYDVAVASDGDRLFALGVGAGAELFELGCVMP